MRAVFEKFFKNNIQRLNFDILAKVLLALIIYFCLVFLVSDTYLSTLDIPKVGDIADRDIIANKTFRYENSIETQKAKDSITERFRPIFDEKDSVVTISSNEVVEFFDFIEKSKINKINHADIYSQFENDFPYIFNEFLFEEILIYQDEGDYKNKILSILNDFYSKGVVNKSSLTDSIIKNIELNGIHVYNSNEFLIQEKTLTAGTIYFWEDINENINKIIEDKYPFLGNDKIETLSILTTTFLQPNLVYNDTKSTIRFDKLKSEVRPIYDIVKKGYTIALEGSVLTENDILIIEQMYKDSFIYNIRVFVALALFMLIIFAISAYTCIHYKNDFFIDMKKYTLLMCELFFIFITIYFHKQTMFLHNWFGEDNIPLYVYTLLPFVIVINTMISGRAFSYFVIYIVTFLATMITQSNLISTLILFTASVVSLVRSEKITKRSQIFSLGLVIFAIYTIGNIVFLIISDITIKSFLYLTLMSFLTALLQIGLISLLLPLCEYLLNTATIFKLQELADLNNPTLKDLQKKAPGTYNHSISIGNLAESIASELGENTLLAKVSGYYHDIGKTENPLYFIENSTVIDNRHKKLKPTISASILKNHIKHGVEIAKNKKLPSKIIDAIREHHGTSIIRYFYVAALKDDENIDESLFRYAGPKPQSKITAVIMLLDAIEAASRTLNEPTKENIKNLIHTIVNSKITEGELSDSQLTLHDIDLIEKRAFQLVVASYHERISYPKIPDER